MPAPTYEMATPAAPIWTMGSASVEGDMARPVILALSVAELAGFWLSCPKSCQFVN